MDGEKTTHTGTIELRRVHFFSPKGDLCFNNDYYEMMSKANLLTFDDIWSFNNGTVVKKTKTGTVIRAHIPGNHSHPQANRDAGSSAPLFYIKKHTQHLGFRQKILSFIPFLSFQSEGMKEFDNYCEFREKGLETVIPVAAGMQFSTFFQVQSFLITQDFSPFIDLEELVLNRQETFLGEENKRKKRNILKAIAHYARKMHEAGLNQKDFNATHVLLLNLDAMEPTVSLFDLQRVDKNRWNRFKWPIKALAELNYTLPDLLFSDSDRLSLLQHYMRTPSLTFIHKLQWAWIRKKTARIARHSKKRGLSPNFPGSDNNVSQR